MTKANKKSRRDALRLAAGVAASIPFFGGLTPRWLPLVPTARAATAPHRFLQIFLLGGWDSALGPDPIIGSKATNNGYEPAYLGAPYAGSTAVAGKANLKVGYGMAGAAGAFAAMPTAFVNGIYVQVTAHELAVNYMYSGQLSLSRSREYPALAAHVGKARGGFPPHVIFGSRIPLGDTTDTPPLQAGDVDLVTSMLAGPRTGSGVLTDTSLKSVDSLTARLNELRLARSAQKAQQSLAPWVSSEAGLASFYGRRLDQQVVLTPAIKARYGIAAPSSSQALMAGAFLALKANLSSVVTVNFVGFDTHFSHFTNQVPALQSVASALGLLVTDLLNTPDPDDPTQSLAATTTILITSEFVRTPKFNLNAGTDHWQSGSAILMGKGVRDNVVVGATDDAGAALGWNAGVAVPFSSSTALLPDHLGASLLRALGYGTIADTISTVNLSELFS